jgi:hypothetical protein
MIEDKQSLTEMLEEFSEVNYYRKLRWSAYLGNAVLVVLVILLIWWFT